MSLLPGNSQPSESFQWSLQDGHENIRHLISAAKHAAADNKAKAHNEAIRGAFHFAKMHEAASIDYAKDAQAMIDNNWPIHHSLDHYFGIAKAYRHLDRKNCPCRVMP